MPEPSAPFFVPNICSIYAEYMLNICSPLRHRNDNGTTYWYGKVMNGEVMNGEVMNGEVNGWRAKRILKKKRHLFADVRKKQ